MLFDLTIIIILQYFFLNVQCLKNNYHNTGKAYSDFLVLRIIIIKKTIQKLIKIYFKCNKNIFFYNSNTVYNSKTNIVCKLNNISLEINVNISMSI